MYMNNVNCRGTELSLFQCDYQSLIADFSPCYQGYNDAGVNCSSKSSVHMLLDNFFISTKDRSVLTVKYD